MVLGPASEADAILHGARWAAGHERRVAGATRLADVLQIGSLEATRWLIRRSARTRRAPAR
jgi:hypothetical protein